VAGIMPVLNLGQLARFKELSGCVIPDELVAFLGEGDASEVAARGVDFATRQCDDLLRHGIAGIHLYSLNQSLSSVRITENLRALGHFPVLTGSKAAKAAG
jgi:methylenetetrahydrofolate reductase (NADPH)